MCDIKYSHNLRLNGFLKAGKLKIGASLAAALINQKAIGSRINDANHIPVNGETEFALAILSPIVIKTK